MMMGFVASTATQAAEVYNKNANKLDVYGKIKAMHYFSDYDSKDGRIRPTCVSVLKAKRRLTTT
ncbi:outer membrane pore protein E [Klebsiella pneumoniae subsp. rhinoscleromatis]|nr:outer membrane pore protein E [Klebsiella pneumoniae subsp. rhinoscleromatis]